MASGTRKFKTQLANPIHTSAIQLLHVCMKFNKSKV